MGISHPWVLGLLLLAPLLAWGMNLFLRQNQHLISAWFRKKQLHLPKPWLRAGLFTAAFVMLVLASAGLHLKQYKVPEQVAGRQIYFLLDVSASMRCQDVSPSRLAQAKAVISKLAGRLKGEQLGLIVHSDYAYVQCPLTRDMAAFKKMLALSQPEQFGNKGTNYRNALQKLAQRFQHVPPVRGRPTSRSAVYLTDGENFSTKYHSVVEQLNRRGIRVYPVGIGTRSGAPVPAGEDRAQRYIMNEEGNAVISRLNPDALTQMAQYFGSEAQVYKGDTTQLNRLYDALQSVPPARLDDAEMKMVPLPLYPYFTAAGLLLLLMGMLALPRLAWAEERGWLRMFPRPVQRWLLEGDLNQAQSQGQGNQQNP